MILFNLRDFFEISWVAIAWKEDGGSAVGLSVDLSTELRNSRDSSHLRSSIAAAGRSPQGSCAAYPFVYPPP